MDKPSCGLVIRLKSPDLNPFKHTQFNRHTQQFFVLKSAGSSPVICTAYLAEMVYAINLKLIFYTKKQCV